MQPLCRPVAAPLGMMAASVVWMRLASRRQDRREALLRENGWPFLSAPGRAFLCPDLSGIIRTRRRYE